jgi:hypothetical protein
VASAKAYLQALNKLIAAGNEDSAAVLLGNGQISQI